MSDWKRGDAALVECSDGKWRPALWGWRACGEAWTFSDGSYRRADDSGARPLVVIDPEDRAQAERLLSSYHKWKWDLEKCDASIEDMQAALREFATPAPVKPEEPRGLGAVVRLASGRRAVRVSCGQWDDEGRVALRGWDDLDATEVLSEGVVQP